MKETRFYKFACLAAMLGVASSALAAEIKIDINQFVPGKSKPTWVSISGISGEALKVLQFDLYVQGFNFTNAEAAQYLISGTGDGSFTGRAMDKYAKNTLVSKAYTGGSLRRQVHTFTDDFVKALSRKPIAAETQIAYRHESAKVSEAVISDFDGANATQVTKDGSMVKTPTWLGRSTLYYSSYKLNHLDIYRHDLSSGNRTVVARHGGSNMSPAPSPDGTKLAMILSKDGFADLYVADADGGNPKRLTKSREDESSPCWSPDSKWICFAAKIKERRSLCKVSPAGGEIQRIPTAGVLNPTEPDWSPDGQWIAFTSMMGGFEICVVPATGGNATQLVSGEDPSWAPNSRTLIFARRSGGALSLLDVPTKQYKDVARISGSSGSNSQPSWTK